MEEHIHMEYETNLSQAFFRVTVAEPYTEDYQMPMLQRNPIDGILPIEGCGVNGASCYTYGVGGCASMSDLYAKDCMKKADIQELIGRLLEVIEILQKHMLNPDGLMLEPEYLFRKAGKWWFCYLPVQKKKLLQSFHELSEYFVKTLDYEDVEGIFLAYELHKATLQEKYDLKTIMEEYEIHEEERKKEEIQEPDVQQEFGNAFTLSDEEECEEEEYVLKRQFHQKWRHKVISHAEMIREEDGWHNPWKRSIWHSPGKNWGEWDDLMTETDGQEESTNL